MYEEFFGLSTRPFRKTPDPAFLYLSKAHEEALARLQYAVEQREIAMLTGEVGCGKTTLTRALMDSLGDACRVVLVLNPRLTPAQLLRVIARRLGIDPGAYRKDGLLDAIYEKVFRDFEDGITDVVIIDEAQLIPRWETFEEIRLLTNFQLDDANLLSLVLVGQPDLGRMMARRKYTPLRQRIGIYCHLGPLGEHEIKGYIEHRLSVAGRSVPLFTSGAVGLIYRLSGGVPRVVNSLADTALIEGFGETRDSIDESLVESASKELGLDIAGLN